MSDPLLISVSGQPMLPEVPTLWGHVPMAHMEDINTLSWHPDCERHVESDPVNLGKTKRLCTAGDDGIIRFWSIPLAITANGSEVEVD
ncbi:unnamed protein product [Echinostoma caproni]|uniref:WD_REPEATS_REGION domain-containing protein n=1 Tax=Echinostoma caproni TaxID=27848 RepID=A0A183AGF5_9TREM|nr:unnamed protein product [Echinostoma caproni]